MIRILSTLFLFCVILSTPHSNAKAAEGHASWGYEGTHGPSHWGDLDPSFSACKTGSEQSPINISSIQADELPALQFDYKPQAAFDVENNGHTIKAGATVTDTLTVGDKSYKLLQFHFHTPSEHYVDGAPYPMEVHFVHQAEDKTLAVVGVMMKVGKENKSINNLWANAKGGSANVFMDDLMPEDKGYYKYEGSLTTPPCSEGVQWHVLKTPIEISEAQLRTFQELFPVNARPIQPVHKREVTGY